MGNRIFSIVTGLLVFAGCTHELKVQAPVPESEYLVIRADCSVLTKTDINQGNSEWSKGDVITVVYDGTAYEYVAEEAGATTYFTSVSGITDYDASKTMTAYYPATTADGTVTVAAERNIEFIADTRANMACAPLVGTPKDDNLEDGALSMVFSNIFSVMELRIDAGELADAAAHLTLEPADETDFDGYLSFTGTVEPNTLAVTPAENGTGNTIRLVFPADTDLTETLTLKFPVGRFSTQTGLKLTLETEDGSRYTKNIYKTGITTYNEKAGNYYAKHLAKAMYAFANPGGIATADDFVSFAAAVNAGESLSPWMNEEGKVVLLDDIDMAGVESWEPIGETTFSWAGNVLSVTSGNPFSGYFDGKGHVISNFRMLCENSKANAAWGLFGAVGRGGVVENIVFDESCSLEVKATAPTDCGIVAGLVYDGIVRNVTNNAPMSFDGNGGDNKRMTMAAVGFAFAEADGVEISNIVNNGEVAATAGGNTKNGATGVHVAGILGFSTNHVSSTAIVNVKECINYGDLTAATGRMSGLVTASNRYTVISDCINYGNSTNSFATAKNARVGNITVITGVGSSVYRTVNYGDVICTTGGGAGGIVCLVNHDGNRLAEVENYGDVITDNAAYSGTFFGVCNKKAIFENCVAQGDYGQYNGGNHVMVGTDAGNYFDYIGIHDSNAVNVTKENIKWTK